MSRGFRTVFEMEAFDGGLNTRDELRQIDDAESPDCLNVVFDDRTVKTRQGSTQLNTAAVGSFTCDGLFTADYNNGTQSMIAVWDDSAYVLSGTSFQTIGSAQGVFASGNQVAFCMYLNIVFMGQSTTTPYKYNGTEFTRHGVPEPGNTTSAVTGGTAGNLNGDYLYKIAYVNSYSAVGDLQSVAVGTITASNEDIVLTSLPVAPQSFGVAQRQIYRTDAGTTTPFKLIATINDNTTTTYNDNIASSAAGIEADTDAGLPPNWRYCVVHQDRLFVVEDVSEPQYLWYSNLGDPFIFPSTSFIKIARGDGEKITGLGVHSNSVIIYKENSVWALYMPDTTATNWVLIRTDAKYGAASNRSIVNYTGTQIYAALRNTKLVGFYGMVGSTSQPQAVNLISSSLFADERSGTIEDDIFDFQRSYAENIAGIEYKNKLYFAVTYGTGQTTNNRIYVYHFHKRTKSGRVIGAWVPWTGLNINQFTVHDGKLYGSSSTPNGFIYQLEDGTYNDDGSAIDSYMWTKEYDEAANDRDYEKDFRTAHFEVENTGNYEMGISYRTDSEDASGQLTQVNLDAGGTNWNTGVWGVDNWDAGVNRKNVKIILGGSRGKRIQFRFDNRNTADRWFKVIIGRFYYNRRGLR
jgi:hypothetical protein